MSTENKIETVQTPKTKTLPEPKSAKEVIEIFKRRPLPFDELMIGGFLPTYTTPLEEGTQKIMDEISEEYREATKAFYRKYFDLLAEKLSETGVMEIWEKINMESKKEAMRDESDPSPLDELSETMVKANEARVKLIESFTGMKVGDGKATEFETVKPE